MKQIENLEPCCIRHHFMLREPVRSSTYIPTQEPHSDELEQYSNGFADMCEEVREVVKTKRFQSIISEFNCPKCGFGCCDCDGILRRVLQLLGHGELESWEEK